MEPKRRAAPRHARAPIHHAQLWETVSSALRQSILSGEYQPGMKLIETDLAEHFGVSRGPIREALRELAREGLVVDLPRRGTLVSTVTLGDLTEIYEVREALECAAVARVVESATPARLEHLRKLLEASESLWPVVDKTPTPSGADYSAALAADFAFHQEILRLSGNRRMAAAYEQMAIQTGLLIRTALSVNPTLRWSPPKQVHRHILSALVARDVDRAKAAVSDHYAHTSERLFTFVDRSDEEVAAESS